MGKNGRRPRAMPSAAQAAAAAAEVLAMRAVQPRSVENLDGKGRELVRELQAVTLELRDLERTQRVTVRKLRAAGVPWSAIGWAVGTSGEAARQRWGDT